MKKQALLFILLVCSIYVNAQIDNEILENRIRPDSAKAGALYLNINNFNFVRNYEYYNRFQDGYTLYGSQLEPQLVYYPNPNLAVLAGAHMRKDFGEGGKFIAEPLFTVKYTKNKFTLNFGVLEGNSQHKYIEPLYDFEYKITRPLEYGTQAIWQGKSYFVDAWISWRRMIYKPSPTKEQILGGVSSEFTLFNNDKFSVSLPVQFMAFHEGGQIDVLKDVPLETVVNTALGLKLAYKTNSTVIQKIYTDNYYSTYNSITSRDIPYKQGNGTFLNLGVKTKFFDFISSYWHADKYVSAVGMPIYQSVSSQIQYPGYVQAKREFIMLRLVTQKKLVDNLYLDVRLEPYIELSGRDSKNIELSNSLFLVYRQDFQLFKKRK